MQSIFFLWFVYVQSYQVHDCSAICFNLYPSILRNTWLSSPYAFFFWTQESHNILPCCSGLLQRSRLEYLNEITGQRHTDLTICRIGPIRCVHCKVCDTFSRRISICEHIPKHDRAARLVERVVLHFQSTDRLREHRLAIYQLGNSFYSFSPTILVRVWRNYLVLYYCECRAGKGSALLFTYDKVFEGV